MIGIQKTTTPEYDVLKKQIKPESGWGELLKLVARHSLSDLRQNGAEVFLHNWLLPLAEDALPPNAGGVVLPENLPYFQMLCALTAYLEIAASPGARWPHPYLPPLSITKNLFIGTAYVTDETGNKLSVLFDPIGQDSVAVINEVRDRFLSLRPDLYWPQHHEQAVEERFGTSSLTEPQRVVSRERFKKNLDTACAAVRTGKSGALVMMTEQSPVPKTEAKPMFPLFLADVFFDKELSASVFKMRLAAEAADCLAITYASSPFVCSVDKKTYDLSFITPKLQEMLSAAVTIGRKVPLETAVKMQAEMLYSIHRHLDCYLPFGIEILKRDDLGLSDGDIELLDALYQTTKKGFPAHFLSLNTPISGLLYRRRIKNSGICHADLNLTIGEVILLRDLLSNGDVSGRRFQVKTAVQTRRTDTGVALPDFATEACMPNGGTPSPLHGFYNRLSEIADIRVTRGVPFNTYDYEGHDDSFFLRREFARNGLTVRFSVHKGKEAYAAALCLYHYALSNYLDIFDSKDREAVIACNAGETFGLSPQELDAMFADENFAGWLKGDAPLRRGTDTAIPSVSQGKIRFAPDEHEVIGAQIRPSTLRRLYAFQNDVFGQVVNDTRPLPSLPKPSAAQVVPVTPEKTSADPDSDDAKRFTKQQSDLALKILLGTNPHTARPDGAADMPNDIRHRGALQKLNAISLHIHGSRLLGGPAPTALLAHGCIKMPVCPGAPSAGGHWKYPPSGLVCTLDDDNMETAYLVLRDLLHHKIAAFPEYKEASESYSLRYGFAAKHNQSHRRPLVCRFEHDQGVPLRVGSLIDLTAEIDPWEVALEKLRLVEEAFQGIAEVFGYERLSAAIQETRVLLSNDDSSASHVRMWEKQTQGVPVQGIFYPVPTEEDVEWSDTTDGIAQIRRRIDDGNIIRSWGGNKIREAALSLQAALDSGYNTDEHNTVF